jgi:hypothetical protein
VGGDSGMSASHDIIANANGVHGYSEWHVRLGRHRRLTGRSKSTPLTTREAVIKWAAKYPDVQDAQIRVALAYLDPIIAGESVMQEKSEAQHAGEYRGEDYDE